VSKRKICLALLLWAVIIPSSSARADPPGDIVCGGSRYNVPMRCLQACTKRPTLANIHAGLCYLTPSCSALQHDPALQQLYNQTVLHSLGPALLPEAQAKALIIGHLIKTHYRPFVPDQFDIRIEDPVGEDSWASLDRPNKNGKPVLRVANDLFLLTPGFIATVVGHEMVHESQHRHTYRSDFTGINSAVQEFRELEASMWELGEASSPGFPDDEFRDCIQDTERAENKQVRDCREWKLNKAIESVISMQRYVRPLELWMNEDPWTKGMWLPNHPDWKTTQAGPSPDAKCAGTGLGPR